MSLTCVDDMINFYFPINYSGCRQVYTTSSVGLVGARRAGRQAAVLQGQILFRYLSSQ